jgi:hypothetical protein
MHTRNVKDFYAGLLFVAFGAAAMVFAAGYRIGSAAKMGPGYFPFVLGGVQALLGLVLLARSLSRKGPGTERISVSVRPVILVLASIVVFGLLLRPLGLLLCTLLLVMGSSMASREFRPREALVNALVLLGAVLVIFVWFLNYQIPVWPQLLSAQP